VDLFLDPHAARPLAGQLYDQLRLAINEGRLLSGDRLTPSRQLAVELGVSRQTVATAYGRLVAEGYAEGRAGGGSVVAPTSAAGPCPPRLANALRPARRFTDWAPLFELSGFPLRYELTPGQPDPALFPAIAWRRQVAAAVAAEYVGYGDPLGQDRLRRAIASWIARSRSVRSGENAIVVTSGAQHAIDLVARVLLETGDTVAVEEPGYPPVGRLFAALGARVAAVPVDGEGLIVDRLPPSARIVYVTPSHQFPLGMTMSMPRRRALLRWAQDHDAAIIEDDYDTEFRYVDRPLEPLQALDDAGRVIYVGSFSKTFSPAIRLGFAVVPPSLAEPIAALRQITDWHPPTAIQTALAGFIEDGLLDRHLLRSRRAYAERRGLLTEALSGPLSTYLTGVTANAGLHITAYLRPGLSEDAVLLSADSAGIRTMGLRQCFHASPPQPGLLLGFGAIPTTALPVALRELEEILAAHAAEAPTAPEHRPGQRT
jgi:GntR family transcriptional regulator/MocR family aminotransferase